MHDLHDATIPELAPSRRNSARYRRALWTGLGISALVHVLLLFGWRSELMDPAGSLAAGPRAGDFRAAAGGGAMLAIAVSDPRPIVIPAPPSTRPRLVEPEVVPQEPETRIIAADLAGPVGGSTVFDSEGSRGIPGADGGGDSGNSAEGRDQVTSPVPRSIIPRWDVPDGMKGMRVTVRVQLDAFGEPTGVIEMQPRIPDSGFDRQLRKDLLMMDYVPASRAGRPVADWAEMTFTF